jgi:hypothetical protein
MFTTRLTRSSAAALVAAAAVAAGCGGEDRLTQDEYAAQLKPAVAQISAGFGSVFERIGRASDDERVPAAALARLGQVAAEEARQADRLAGLEPPEDLEAAHDRFAAGAQEQAERLATLARSRSTTVGELADAVEQGATTAPLRELVSRGVVPAPGR